MNLKAKTSNLLKEIQLVYGVIERKATIPILSNILMEAKKDKLHLTATDIEVTLKSQCPASVKTDGAITLSGQKLFDSIRFLPIDSEIHIKLNENNWATVNCERTKYRIAGISSEEFPSIQKSDYKKAISISWDNFKKMINKVFFSISAEETRYALRGALVNILPEGISIIATDGHRLACITNKEKLSIKKEDSFKAIVTKKTLQELMKVGEEEEEVVIKQMENHVFFKLGSREVISSIVEGEFPDYKKVVEDKKGDEIIIETQKLNDALKRVSPFSNEKLRGITMNIQGSKMEVMASSAEQGEAHETLDVDYKGENVKISFNSKYILEFLNVVGSEQIKMKVVDENSKAIFKPVDDDALDYLYVVMPMTL
jgi:DNA polymerase-3 subunit beta